MAQTGSGQLGSPFLHPGLVAKSKSLAILRLRRDDLLPVVLQSQNATSGYHEGAVTNTRFGSYPHTTIIGEPWGTQVGASKVDTGSRGAKAGKKRKRVEIVENSVDDDEQAPKTAVAATSGFCHLLPPTAETWTVSLPHRTQVVYTPDYSFILQKLQARPGSVVIEAGAGSGSFTHAAARAVFSGYQKPNRGRVFSFEYHEPRAESLRAEIAQHGLKDIVTLTHRDVYEDGFLVREKGFEQSSPNASAVFLDLPSPWQALPHLTRAPGGPLDPNRAVHICLFLPCIEQVQMAVASLREHGWVEVGMQELAHRRIEVRRERVGLDLQGLRGVNASAATVEESVARLVALERGLRRPGKEDKEAGEGAANEHSTPGRPAQARKHYKEGRLVSRTEPDVRTHTSYLVFGVLPMAWAAADEARCQAAQALALPARPPAPAQAQAPATAPAQALPPRPPAPAQT